MRYLGIEIGSNALRVLRLQKSGRGVVADLFLEEPIPAAANREEALRSAFANLAQAGALKAEVVAASLPDAPTISSYLTLPFGDPKVIEQVLPAQMQGRLPKGIEHVHDFQVLGEAPGDEPGFEVLVLSYPERALGTHIELLDAGGIEPQVVLPLAYTEHRAARFLRSGDAEAYALVDIGAATSQVTVMKGERFIQSRTLLVGGDSVTAALAEALGTDDYSAEQHKLHQVQASPGPLSAPPPIPGTDPMSNIPLQQVAVRIGLQPLMVGLRQTLAALSMRHHLQIDRILVTGGGARLRGLNGYISSQLGVSCEALTVNRSELFDVLVEDQQGAVVAPLSLALAAADMEGGGLELNLRRGRFAFKGNLEFLKERALSFAVMGLLLIGAFGFMMAMKFSALSTERDKLSTALSESSEAVFASEAMSTEEIDRQLKRARGFSFLPQRTALHIYNDMSRVLTSTFGVDEEGLQTYLDYEFDTIEIDTIRDVVKIKGNADTEDTLQRVKDALAWNEEAGTGIPCFPKNIQESQLANQRGRVSFTLNIEANCDKSEE